MSEMKKSRESAFRPDAYADVFKAAVPHREGYCAHHFLVAGEKSNLGIPERQTFKDVVVRSHYIEQLVVTRAIKDRLTIARAFDRDGLLSCAL